MVSRTRRFSAARLMSSRLRSIRYSERERNSGRCFCLDIIFS